MLTANQVSQSAMRTSLDWCIYFFDGRRVLDFLEAQVTLWDSSRPKSLPMRAYPRTVAEIANGTRIFDWRVRACLRQLASRDLVEQEKPDQWRIVLNGSNE